MRPCATAKGSSRTSGTPARGQAFAVAQTGHQFQEEIRFGRIERAQPPGDNRKRPEVEAKPGRPLARSRCAARDSDQPVPPGDVRDRLRQSPRVRIRRFLSAGAASSGVTPLKAP